MNLFRNIIMAFVAFVVMGVAAPAFAKTNLETVACRDAGFAALPFSGTATEKEAYAKNLAIGTEVLVDGITVPLASGESLWSKCKTGPSAIEIANARVSALETENARLNGLAYHTVTDGSGRQIRVSWKSTATATAAALETAKGKNAADMKAASKADFWQYLTIFFLVIAVLVVCFRTTIGDKLDALGAWFDNPTPAKLRKKAAQDGRPASPAAPTDIDSLQSDNRSTHAPGQP